MSFPVQPTGLYVRAKWPKWEHRDPGSHSGHFASFFTWFEHELYRINVSQMRLPNYYMLTLLHYQDPTWNLIHHTSMLDDNLCDLRLIDYKQRLEAYIVLRAL